MAHPAPLCTLALLCAIAAPLFAHDTITVSGRVTDRAGQPVPRCDVIFNPSAFIGDDSLYFKCDQQGRYRAEIPVGHYNSLYAIDLPEYGKTQLEFWGWNLQLDKDEVIDLAFDTIEVYSLAVWASNGGARSVFAAFRPMHLASALAPNVYRKQIEGQDLAIFDITPQLSAEGIQASIDGQPVRLQSFFWSYEETGACGEHATAGIDPDEPCHMPMIIAQFERPKLDAGKHQLRIRLTDSTTGEIGEGLTHFVSNAVGLGF
ncbi:carboxypeptidase-like regulatory domain-containing protein [Ferrimonas pelagia]|uniref:Carboxypeptidase regulatory-like domain-containing protein n=1 Tax=Ferrimonas pelagia TaxID=1177826 RepID=A0ABP9EZ62_9GAMM